MKHEGRAVIRVGDKTSHGGQVISASSGTVVMGKLAALDGDMSICPQCKGKFALKPDSAGAKHEGKPYAYHDDLTECGARLISSLSFSSGVAGGDQSGAGCSQEFEGEDGNQFLVNALEGKVSVARATNPEKVNNYFNDMYGPIRSLSIRMKTNEDLLFSLSSAECAWLDEHNRSLHNPWGLTRAGGRNLSFESFQAATDYFETKTQWGRRLRGIEVVDDFIKELLTPPKYNSVNHGYETLLRRQFDTVVRRKEIWMQQRPGK
ncbi:MAG: PAAR domain-containing protein [Burkholderiaceae bacterium]|nr:PAAR domain-containing protein [Burkholderiaceae bacterium]